jgi:hypothetical protein
MQIVVLFRFDAKASNLQLKPVVKPLPTLINFLPLIFIGNLTILAFANINLDLILK